MRNGDEADRAQEHIERFTEEALRRQREKSKREPLPPDFDGTCIDCDIEIPTARAAMGKLRCVDCQTIFEKEQKRGYR